MGSPLFKSLLTTWVALLRSHTKLSVSPETQRPQVLGKSSHPARPMESGSTSLWEWAALGTAEGGPARPSSHPATAGATPVEEKPG